MSSANLQSPPLSQDFSMSINSSEYVVMEQNQSDRQLFPIKNSLANRSNNVHDMVAGFGAIKEVQEEQKEDDISIHNKS